jgi:hypothetical protein
MHDAVGSGAAAPAGMPQLPAKYKDVELSTRYALQAQPEHMEGEEEEEEEEEAIPKVSGPSVAVLDSGFLYICSTCRCMDRRQAGSKKKNCPEQRGSVHHNTAPT